MSNFLSVFLAIFSLMLPSFENKIKQIQKVKFKKKLDEKKETLI